MSTGSWGRSQLTAESADKSWGRCRRTPLIHMVVPVCLCMQQAVQFWARMHVVRSAHVLQGRAQSTGLQLGALTVCSTANCMNKHVSGTAVLYVQLGAAGGSSRGFQCMHK